MNDYIDASNDDTYMNYNNDNYDNDDMDNSIDVYMNDDTSFTIDMDDKDEKNEKDENENNTNIHSTKTPCKNIVCENSTTGLDTKKKYIITKKIINNNNNNNIPEHIPDTKDKHEDKKKNKDKDKDKDNEKNVIKTTPDDKFEFNEVTINFYTNDNKLNIKNICVKKSTFKNDTVLLCLLFKEQVMIEYKCSVIKCKTGKLWLGKSIQLLINRKNGKLEDLTISNLELMCPNCFIVQYGIILFQKILSQTVYKCKLCDFPLYKFSNSKKKDGYCISCENKLINLSFNVTQNKYINELKNTIEPTQIDKIDKIDKIDFSNSTYYNEVSQYKIFKNKSSPKNKTSINTTNDTHQIDTLCNISLNMSIPNIPEFINNDNT